MPLMSKNNGLYKKVKTFNGKGQDEISTEDPVWALLKAAALLTENLLNSSNEASSNLVNFNTIGKIAIAIPIIAPKKRILLNIEISFPVKYAMPQAININKVIWGLIKQEKTKAKIIKGKRLKGANKP